ncbi:MAG: ATP-binding protein [Verrucomicrobiota bacterium]
MNNASFIGRKNPLAILQQQYQRSSGALAVIYGRRRVGKTELIRQFIHGKPAIFFTGKEAPRQILIDDFLEQAGLFYGHTLASPGEVSSWKAALGLAVAGARKGARLVLVFDEIQWAASEKASPELISTLQELWDHQWQRDGRIMLILCSSFIGYSERLLGSKSPLFGRTTAQIQLQPLSPAEAAQFHPGYSLTHQAQAYFITGGVPLYHRYFESGKSIEQNLIAHFLTPSSPLFREGDFLLREEFKELPSYFAILTVLAGYRQRHKAVLEQTGLSDLQYYLHRLSELNYVRRVWPLASRSPRTEVYFEIQDPFLRFWFRFLFKRLSAIDQFGPEAAFERLIKPQLDAFFGECFEGFCRDRMAGVYIQQEKLTCPFKVGEYWKTGKVQIDVVGQRDDGWTDLGECKWGRVRSLPDALGELEAKVALYPLAAGQSVGRRLFLHHPPKTRLPGPVKVHSLADLYQLG